MSQTLLQVKIVTPDKKVFQSEAIMVHSETQLGKIEFLVNHAPAILSTVPCETIVKDEDGTQIRFFTSKGIISIKDNILSFCCDSAEAIEDIDIERAKKSKEKALRRMADPEKYNYKRAKDSLLRAEVRLKMKKNNVDLE